MKPPKILSRSKSGAARGPRKGDDSGLQPRIAPRADSERAESGVWRSGQAASTERKPKRDVSDTRSSYGDKPRRTSSGSGSGSSFAGYKGKTRRDDQSATNAYQKPRVDGGFKKTQGDDQGAQVSDKPWRTFSKEVASAGTSYARKPKREFSGERTAYADKPKREYGGEKTAYAGYTAKPKREFAATEGTQSVERKPWANRAASGTAYDKPRTTNRADYTKAADATGGFKPRFEKRQDDSAQAGTKPFVKRDAAATQGSDVSERKPWTPRPAASAYIKKAAGSFAAAAPTTTKQESFDRPKRSALFGANQRATTDFDLDEDDIADMEEGSVDSAAESRPDYLPRRSESAKLSGERHPALAQRAREIRIYGRHAVLAVFRDRPDAIRKLYYTRAAQTGLGDLFKHLAQSQVSYREVTPEELVKIASSEHHEGLVADVLLPTAPEFAELLTQLAELPRASVVLLDGVSNPHNFGALLRICAHFGVDAVLLAPKHGADLADPNDLPLSGAMYRVAEGGAEATPMLRLTSLSQLDAVRALGFEAIAAHPHDAVSLHSATLPKKLLLMLGAEGAGLSPAMLSFASRRLAIPGSGKVESLNVAQAAAVLLAEVGRQRAL